MIAVGLIQIIACQQDNTLAVAPCKPPYHFPYPQNGITILHRPNLADDGGVQDTITSRDSLNSLLCLHTILPF